ncbi:MAG: UDP-N-acetylmuramate dehydrogenase [Lachnospiraceae bacterium]|nr:UDP-N-acetylmuramate dehydrogenase [Lachnospiraceae bacterium]
MSFEIEIKRLEGKVLCQEPLSRHTTFRIGGPADYYVMPESVEELKQVIALCRQYQVPFQVMGNGSNLLCADDGVEGVIIDVVRGLNHCEVDEENGRIRAQAGVMLATLARKAQLAGLTGLEFAAGIPGSVGGALVMNAGAYGGEMKQVVHQARVLTAEGQERVVSLEELDLSYRHSAIRPNGWIVLEVIYQLQPGDAAQIRATMDDLAVRRREKQPLEFPSAGSTFKRPVGYFAAQLIDEAGLKGFAVGGAQVSEKHAGFVINRGGATAADVMALCEAVKERIRQRVGVELEMEVERIGGRTCHFPPM